MTRRPRTARGSAVPFAVACLGVLVMVGGALAVVSALVVGHRLAQSAADLAALAGARAHTRGGDGCDAALRVAARNHALLDGCRLAGPDVEVTVVVRGPRWLGATGDLRARARAGPG